MSEIIQSVDKLGGGTDSFAKQFSASKSWGSTGILSSNVSINSGGWYVENGVWYVNCIVQLAKSFSAGSTVVIVETTSLSGYPDMTYPVTSYFNNGKRVKWACLYDSFYGNVHHADLTLVIDEAAASGELIHIMGFANFA